MSPYLIGFLIDLPAGIVGFLVALGVAFALRDAQMGWYPLPPRAGQNCAAWHEWQDQDRRGYTER